MSDEDELKTVQDYVFRRRKAIREFSASEIPWRIGMEVKMKEEYQNKKPYDSTGVIKKVNPKNVLVNFDGSIGRFNVPKSMLEVVGEIG